MKKLIGIQLHGVMAAKETSKREGEPKCWE